VFGEQLEVCCSTAVLFGGISPGSLQPEHPSRGLVYDSAVLKQYSALHRRWSKEQIMVPLFITEEELRLSATVFPLEFLEIQEQHRVLGGRDPFIGFHVKTDR